MWIKKTPIFNWIEEVIVITSSVPVTETNFSILSWHSSLLGTSMSSSESDDDESLMMMQDLVQLDVDSVDGS